MKTFEHQKDTNFCILKAFDHSYENIKGQQPKLISLKINACFYVEKPEVGNIIISPAFNIHGFEVTEIIENRDAKTDHWPKEVNKKKYSEDDLKRPESKGHSFNPEKAFFVLKLEKKA